MEGSELLTVWNQRYINDWIRLKGFISFCEKVGEKFSEVNED